MIQPYKNPCEAQSSVGSYPFMISVVIVVYNQRIWFQEISNQQILQQILQTLSSLIKYPTLILISIKALGRSCTCFFKGWIRKLCAKHDVFFVSGCGEIIFFLFKRDLSLKLLISRSIAICWFGHLCCSPILWQGEAALPSRTPVSPATANEGVGGCLKGKVVVDGHFTK